MVGEISFRDSWTTGMKKSVEILSSKKVRFQVWLKLAYFLIYEFWGVANSRFNYPRCVSINLKIGHPVVFFWNFIYFFHFLLYFFRDSNVFSLTLSSLSRRQVSAVFLNGTLPRGRVGSPF